MAVVMCCRCDKVIDLDWNNGIVLKDGRSWSCLECCVKYDEICPECQEPKPDDERVAAGMKCGECAYGGGK